MLNAKTLLFAQLVAHTAFFYFIIVGTVSQWFVAFLVYFFSGCIGMTATYHRLLSHRSWDCPKWIEYMGVLCATIGMTGSALAWVAVHRKHHKYADQEKDPHCPSRQGFVYCQWFSMFAEIELKYVTDMVREPFYQWQHRFYFAINLSYALVLFVFVGPLALIYAWLVPACILWNAGSLIVTFAHMFGTNDNRLNSFAKNNFVLGILVWGEGWHNNHHANAKLKKFSKHWWQIDIGYWYICTVEFFRGK